MNGTSSNDDDGDTNSSTNVTNVTNSTTGTNGTNNTSEASSNDSNDDDGDTNDSTIGTNVLNGTSDDNDVFSGGVNSGFLNKRTPDEANEVVDNDDDVSTMHFLTFLTFESLLFFLVCGIFS